jgi:hypothetical protein
MLFDLKKTMTQMEAQERKEAMENVKTLDDMPRLNEEEGVCFLG